jgi:alcohol dehydrogenase
MSYKKGVVSMIDYQKTFRFSVLQTDVIFGFGVLQNIAENVRELGGSKVLVVTDPGVFKAGVVEKVASALEQGGIPFEIFAEIPQDSSSKIVQQAVSVLKESGCDVVVGVGGGSSLDASKAVAFAATNPPPITQYAGLDNLRTPGLPVIAIPTTAGTGSEVSFWSIMTNDETKEKIAVGGKLVYPSIALCDPELTIGLPPFITATTGIDALTHAIESFVNTSYQPISEIFTYRAIELIGEYLVRAVKDGSDREARYGMLLGSTLAGIGMNPTRLGIVHALAMPLGSWHLKIAHGTGNAILLPHVMTFNAETAPGPYKRVAQALGADISNVSDQEAAQLSVEIVRNINKEIGIPAHLSEVGLTENMIPKVCEVAMKSGNIAVNPRPCTQSDLEKICKEAL